MKNRTKREILEAAFVDGQISEAHYEKERAMLDEAANVLRARRRIRSDEEIEWVDKAYFGDL